MSSCCLPVSSPGMPYWCCAQVIPAHSDPVTGVDVSGDGTLIASSSYDGICRIWNAHNGAAMPCWGAPSTAACIGMHACRASRVCVCMCA